MTRGAFTIHKARAVLTVRGLQLWNRVPVPFREFRPLYPPHPARTWAPKDIRKIRNFVTQLKLDDWRTLVYFSPGGKIDFYSRNQEKFSRYRPPPSLLQSLGSLDLSKKYFHVLDGGLLHYKTPRIRNTLVLWDVLVHDSLYLLGKTYRQRYKLLERIARFPKSFVSLDSVPLGLKISKNLWLAQNIEGSPKDIFNSAIRIPEVEGIVLKDQNAPLERSYRKDENARWQIRIRRPRIDYPF